VGGDCLERVYSIDTSVITGHQDIVGVWTQPMQDIVAPPISSIEIEGGTTASTVEDQVVGTDLGTLTISGANAGHGGVTWSLTSTTLTGDKLRIVDNELEVGPNAIGASDAGTYNVVVKATDTLGAEKESTFVLTITSNDITNIALSATEVAEGDIEGTDVGDLASTGGVGDVNFSITNDGGLDNLKITDTGTSTATLEVDTGGIIDSAGTYTVRITATDSLSPSPQTYYEDFTITVLSGFANTKALSRTSTNADVVYFNYGQPSSVFNSGSGNFFLDDWYVQQTRATDSYSLSMWFKITDTPDSSTVYSLFQSAADYATASSPINISNKYGSNGPNKDDDGTFKVGSQYGNGIIWHTPASSVDVADGEWHHFALTWDGSLNSLIETTSTSFSQTGTAKHLGSTGDANLRVYIDGEICVFHANNDYGISTIRDYGEWQSTILGPHKRNFAKRVTSANGYESATTPGNYGWGFGYMYASSNHLTLGASIDEFSFHNITLTATQVGELYNSGVPVAMDNTEWTVGTWTTANCLAWFRMFEGDNDSNTTIESVAIGPNGDGTIDLYDWDNTAGSEGYIASDPARTVTPTITIKNGSGNEVVTLTALADGDVYIP
jgi:hypothetical protein